MIRQFLNGIDNAGRQEKCIIINYLINNRNKYIYNVGISTVQYLMG